MTIAPSVFVATLLASPGVAVASPFLAPLSVHAGDGPHDVHTADLDADGLDDLVVVDRSSSTVSVVLDPAGTAVRGEYPVGAGANSVAVGDFDGDGSPDLAVAAYSDDLALLINDGAGGFLPAKFVAEGKRAQAVATADLDADGKLDLVVGNGDGTGKITVLMGATTSGFAAPTHALTGGYGTVSVATGDLDGDGFDDVVTANQLDKSVSVLIGNGNGTFQAASVSSAGREPSSVALADLDGDGDLDLGIVVESVPSKILVRLGRGDGTFAQATPYVVGRSGQCGRLLAADLDSDGVIDLAMTFYGGVVYLFWGRGDGTFQEPTVHNVGYRPDAVATGDFDADGIVDLATSNPDTDDASVIAGLGGREFAAARYYAADGLIGSVEVGDLDNDGLPDLVGTTVTAVDVRRGTTRPGHAPFGGPREFSAGNFPRDLAIGDVDGDGSADLAVANSSGDVGVLIGAGDGQFPNYQAFPTLGVAFPNLRDVDLADLDGDGDLDMIAADVENDSAVVLLGTGVGAFGAATHYPTGAGPISVAAGDVDGDGVLDLVTANYDSATHTASVLLGVGNGTFGANSDFVLGASGSPNDVDLADLDGDGDLDLISVLYSAGGIGVVLGNGNGTFQPAVSYSAGASPLRGAVGDFDGDGRLDYAVANSGINGGTPSVGMFLGNGDGTLQPMQLVYAGGQPYALAVADLNGDGRDDLAIGTLAFQGFSVLLQGP